MYYLYVEGMIILYIEIIGFYGIIFYILALNITILYELFIILDLINRININIQRIK